jgi:hypothetical protein
VSGLIDDNVAWNSALFDDSYCFLYIHGMKQYEEYQIGLCGNQ